MSLLSSVIPTASAQVAHTATQQPVMRADASSAQNAAVQNAVVSGQAAVVSLSSNSTKRAATHGESKSVDAGFDAQTAKEKVEQKAEKQTKSTGGSFKATA